MSADPFADPAAVARYIEETPRRVPGFADLHRRVVQLLSERAPAEARILVLGAGGGLELKAFAEARPSWTFVGVDSSEPMLDLASKVLGPLGSREELLHGLIEDAPAGPFDGATCLLTLHFLDIDERLAVLRALRQRLKPGAPLLIAHHGDPGAGQVVDWLARTVRFATGPQGDATTAVESAQRMAERLTLLTAGQEATLLREAGFIEPSMFYAALSFQGWVAYAGRG